MCIINIDSPCAFLLLCRYFRRNLVKINYTIQFIQPERQEMNECENKIREK